MDKKLLPISSLDYKACCCAFDVLNRMIWDIAAGIPPESLQRRNTKETLLHQEETIQKSKLVWQRLRAIQTA